MNKSCQNCKLEFVIDERDQNYYNKINVPFPTWCGECRRVRRFSMQNTWNLFWRNCAKCGERTLSVYNPEQEIEVYCQPCWWADDWDGTEYAMDYDPSRPFLDQVRELSEKTPYCSLTSLYTSNKNCDYANALAWSKECYLVFWADYCENVLYSSLLNTIKTSSDILRAKDCENCYESIGINKCYQTYFSEECDNCMDVYFSKNCYNCTNCIGCVNLRGGSYQIFNQKYSKEDYLEKVKELGLDSHEMLQELKKQAEAFWLTQPRRVYNGNSLNLNVTGEYTYESKNAHEMYICSGAEDSKWCEFITVEPAKDCYDYAGWGNNASLIYECVTVGENSSNVKFSFECWPECMNIEYGIFNISGKNNLGCVNLKRKQYCILNKEYSKEEYEILKEQIIADMKANPYVDKLGRKFYYGEFFSPEFSKVPYNKSNAMRFFPKTKEEALVEGYLWYDEEPREYEITINAEDLPNKISETEENIVDGVIGCSTCHKGYKITPNEFTLLQKMNLPIPHSCPSCRQNSRFAKLNPPKLWDRNCDKCGKEIRTAYEPGRPEKVYCESCYTQEVA